jgi:hypothetical protein
MIAEHPTADTAPHPVLFNAWKHHAGWVRERIAEAAAQGDEGLKQLADQVVVTGTKLMDVYTGDLPPWAVGERVVHQLTTAGRHDEAEFRHWVESHAGYVVVDLPDDGSRWVLRAGEPGGRYVHLHTARYSPHSLRISGLTLKTVIVANALALTRGQLEADLATVNEARKRFLQLPPVAKLTADGGIGEVLRLLS